MSEDLIPKGEYAAYVDGEPVIEQNPNGKRYIAVRLALPDAPSITDDVVTITWQAWITPAAIKYSIRDLRKLGFQGTRIDDLSSVKHGTPTTVTIDHETYNGRTRHKIAGIGAKPQPLTADSAKQVADEVEALIKLADKEETASAAPPDSGDIESDDIPFVWLPFLLTLSAVGGLFA